MGDGEIEDGAAVVGEAVAAKTVSHGAGDKVKEYLTHYLVGEGINQFLALLGAGSIWTLALHLLQGGESLAAQFVYVLPLMLATSVLVIGLQQSESSLGAVYFSGFVLVISSFAQSLLAIGSSQIIPINCNVFFGQGEVCSSIPSDFPGLVWFVLSRYFTVYGFGTFLVSILLGGGVGALAIRGFDRAA